MVAGVGHVVNTWPFMKVMKWKQKLSMKYINTWYLALAEANEMAAGVVHEVNTWPLLTMINTWPW
jgi:hypothetical protein